MSGRSLSGFVGVVLASAFVATIAQADEWRVVQSSGDVWIGSDSAQPVSLGSTETLADGATLITGKSGRAMLVHDGQTMLVGPNSVASVPKSGDQGGFVTVLERTGAIEFDVDKQTAPHFAVETPYLAAVVKGTHFTVTIDGGSASVAVARGLVAVSDLATGEAVDTPLGQTAMVSGPDTKLTISGSGLLAPITQGSPRAPVVAALSSAELATLQAARPDNGNGSVPGLTTVRPSSTGAGLVAVASISGDDNGGPGGGNTGGGGQSGDTSANAGNGGSGAAVAQQEIASYDVPNGRSGSGYGTSPSSVDPYLVALVLGLSVLLALGLAFLRGRST